MHDDQEAALRDAVARLPSADSPAQRRAELGVSEHAIRMWCSAIGEQSPVHYDDCAARAAGYDGVIAPEAMLQTWAMPIGVAAGRTDPTLHSKIRAITRALGLPAVVATDYEHHYVRPVHPGDLLTETSWIESVSPTKTTTLGVGHFVSIVFEMRNQHNERVGRLRARTFYFDRDGARQHTRRAQPEPSDPVGAELDALQIPVTRTLIVSGALASNDHEAVHHDHTVAQEQGLTDIISSIVTTAGLVNRYVKSWAGPDRHLRKLSLRLAQPAYPDDVLVLSGRAVARDDHALVLIEGTHGRGTHVRAEVEVAYAPQHDQER